MSAPLNLIRSANPLRDAVVDAIERLDRPEEWSREDRLDMAHQFREALRIADNRAEYDRQVANLYRNVR